MTFLGIYAKLKYPLVSAIDIIGREKMRESAFAQEWVAEGREAGLSIARRADIVRVLRSRLKLTETEELAAALELIKEPDRLDHLFDIALTCATIDEFRAALS